MKVGFNYPWPGNRYITIGPNLSPRGQPQPWTQDKQMEDNLMRLKQAGVSVVRIWLMGHGANYDGEVTCRPGSRGWEWDFKPPDIIPSAFLDDFAKLLGIFEAVGMQMIPVFIDFGFFDAPPRTLDEAEARRSGGKPLRIVVEPYRGSEVTDGNYFRGRRAIATNPQYGKTFLEGTLKPLVRVAAKHMPTVYAFEIINEPYWCIAHSALTGKNFGTPVGDKFVTFLAKCVETVQRFGVADPKAQPPGQRRRRASDARPARLPVTIGHRYYSDYSTMFKVVPVDQPQFHYYAHWWHPSDILPELNGHTAPKPFLGEFGDIPRSEFERRQILAWARSSPLTRQQTQDARADLDRIEIMADLWPALKGKDDDQRNLIPERLSYLLANGYELALIWPSEVVGPPDKLKLTATQLQQIKTWTQSH